MLKNYRVDEPLVLTHRGLEPSNADFFSESSLEAFANHLQRGFGIEFDFNRTQDNQIVILHDSTLSRITDQTNTSNVEDVTAIQLENISLKNGSICFFDRLIPLLVNSSARYHALHLKGNLQTPQNLELLLEALDSTPELLRKLILFDLQIESAKFLKCMNSDLQLALSVAHQFDIERYNAKVYKTLYSIDEAVKHRELFDWVWLDEWDLSDRNGTSKEFYTRTTFEVMRTHDFKIAVVTPELHGTSPGLLGGESHPDSKTKEALFLRIKQIISLRPNVLCTDYPTEVLELIRGTAS